jgi:hypothetical protein
MADARDSNPGLTDHGDDAFTGYAAAASTRGRGPRGTATRSYAATRDERGARQRRCEAGAGPRDAATARSASATVRRALMATAAATPAPAAVGTNARGSAQLPAAYTRSTVVACSESTTMEPSSRSSQPSAREVVSQPPADVEEQRLAVERLAVAESDPTEAPGTVALQRDDRRFDDGDAEGVHARELVGGGVVRAVAEQDDIVGPLAQQDGEVLVAVLEAVAVRAGVRAGATVAASA